MSQIGFCPAGETTGILVTEKELEYFAGEMNAQVIDQFIPLPNVITAQQQFRVTDCKHDEHHLKYWEVKNKGQQHGWCCSHCGTVMQWG